MVNIEKSNNDDQKFISYKLIKRLILSSICMLFSQTLWPNSDSLVNELNRSIENDDAINASRIALVLGDVLKDDRKYDDALFYLEIGIKYATSDQQKGEYLKKKGEVYIDSTNYKNALLCLNEAQMLFSSIEMNENLGQVYNLKGMCYGLTGELDTAIAWFNQAKVIKEELKDSAGLGYAFFNLGLANYLKGDYNIAVKNYVQALKIREQIKDTSEWVASLTTIGELLRTQEQYADAMFYYEKALLLKEGIHNMEVKAYIYSEIALIQKKIENDELALQYIDTAMFYCEKAGYKRGKATLFSYRAGIQKKNGQTSSAIKSYKNALAIYREIFFKQGCVQANNALAEIYIDLNRFASADSMLKNANLACEKMCFLEEEAEIYRLYYMLYKKQGKSAAALEFHEKYIEKKDSLYSIQNEDEIKKIEGKYQLEKKEQQIKILDQTNKIQQQKLQFQKYLLLAIVFVVLLLILFILLWVRHNRLQTQYKVENSRQKLLRTQMNPHFIYNSLSAIQNFIMQNDPLESISYISNFSKLMRLVLEGSRKSYIRLLDDVELNTHYLRLQQLRFNNGFDFYISIDNSIDQENIFLPPMLIQPFIENAVEYGMRGQSIKAGLIQISYLIRKNDLVVTIWDNGKGAKQNDVAKNKNHRSLATQITKERIENINKLQHIRIVMEIAQNVEFEGMGFGYMVRFEIPQLR